MNRILIAISLALIFSACGNKKKEQQGALEIPLGKWRAVIHLQDQELPFTLVSRQDEQGEITFAIINGEEEIALDEYFLKKDSIEIPLHIFDTRIVAKVEGDSMKGYWEKNYVQDYQIPFSAKVDANYRFQPVNNPINYDFSGKWMTTFHGVKSETPAIGIFDQAGNLLNGTFLKPTGDYRFLSGNLTSDGFQLSTFDGEHAYLFKAQKKDNDTLKGEFWSGKTGYYKWTAYRDADATLADAYSMTKITEQKIDMAFPNVDGDTVRLSDDRYEDQVVIIQVLGTWCPNCMDETAFLSQWYRKNSNRGVEIIGLAFERKGDLEYGTSRIRILKDRYDIDYQILFAGKRDQQTIEKALPFIEELKSFPTTIFLDQNKEVHKVHTGFSGPGTGEYYEIFVREFNETIDRLVR